MSDYDIYQTDTDLDDEELGEDGDVDDGASEGEEGGAADHVEDDELLEGDEAEEE